MGKTGGVLSTRERAEGRGTNEQHLVLGKLLGGNGCLFVLATLGRPSFTARRKLAIQTTLLQSFCPHDSSAESSLRSPLCQLASFFLPRTFSLARSSAPRSCFVRTDIFLESSSTREDRKNGDTGASRVGSLGKGAEGKKRETVKRATRALDGDDDGRVPRSVGLFVLPVRRTRTATRRYEGERILGGVVNFSTKLPFSSFFLSRAPPPRLPRVPRTNNSAVRVGNL